MLEQLPILWYRNATTCGFVVATVECCLPSSRITTAVRHEDGIVNLFGPTSGGDQFSAWLRWDGRARRVVQAVVVSPVTSFQVLKRLAISRRYSSAWRR